MRSFGSSLLVALALLAAVGAQAAAQGTAEPLLAEAMRREALLRRQLDTRPPGSAAVPLVDRMRTLAQTYEDIARLFPESRQAPMALWQGARLAAAAYFEFRDSVDRAVSLKLFDALQTGYPESPLTRQVAAETARLAEPKATTPAAHAPAPPGAARAPAPPAAMLTAVRRESLPDAMRVVLELDREVPFRDERVDDPPRVVVDLQGTRAVEPLRDATLTFTDDVVRQIRVGRQLEARTRVVVDLQDAARHSVYALYNPFRVVVDVERTAAPAAVAPAVKNAAGGFSLSRQLGLGVARIVIDPGHGGRDPGAQVQGLHEADLTLDIARRLEKLLEKERGVEVILTRRNDAFVPLEERTAIANRAAADLFLSIHTNASADQRAGGVETYFLDFASSAAAEAVAARENAASSRTMRELPDIVKAIALNNKADESRDFARFVQTAMYEKLRRVNRDARDLGVKQAPFVVLIGATMPSVLVEISFLTNQQEATLLKTARYRDQVAEALFAGVMRYQRSLKTGARATATATR